MAVKEQVAAKRPRLAPARFAVPTMILSAGAWGMGFVMSKAVVATIPPVTLLAIQLSASVSALWLATALLRVQFRPRDLRHGWTGVFEPGVAYLLSVIGIRLTTASSASLISALEPFIILLLAFFWLREALSLKALLLLCVSVFGVLLVTNAPMEADAAGALTGDLLILVGTAAAAFYVISSRKSVADMPPLPLAAAQQSVGLGVALLVLPFALFVGGELAGLSGIPAGMIAFAALSGLVQYSLAFSLYLAALKHIPATQAAVYLTLIPVFGLAGSALFLGEQLTAVQLTGAALVVGALWILNGHR